jgi:hypothetical protein
MIDSVYDQFVLNTSGEDVPPFGCMALVSADLNGSEMQLQCRKPTSSDVNRGDPARFLFNKGNWIPAGKTGVASPVLPCWALIDESTGVNLTDEYASFCGPKVNSWSLQKGCLFNAVAKHLRNPHTVGTVAAYQIEHLRQTTLVGVTTSIISTSSGGTWNPSTRTSGSWAGSGRSFDGKTVVSNIPTATDVEAKVVNGVWFLVELC